MHFYPRHVGDYARDAGYLTLLEHGAYTVLMDWCYANEQPLDPKLVFAICRASSRAEKMAVTAVLQRFFQYDGKVWRHKRIEAEIAKYKAKTEKARQSIKARWDKQKDTNVLRTNTERITNQEPITNNQNESPKIEKKILPPPIATLATGVQRGGGSGWVGELVKPFSEKMKP